METDATQAAEKTKPIVIAQIIGAPPKIAQKLSAALVKAAEKRHIAVAKGKNPTGEYSVRGYLVATPDKKGTKLSYIWDVTDSTGKKTHRIKGEELISTKQFKTGVDPWTLVSDKSIESIATKTAARLAAWLPDENKTSTVADNKTDDKTTKKTTQLAQADKSAAEKKPVAKKKLEKKTKVAKKQPLTTGNTKTKKPAKAPVKIAKSPASIPQEVVAIVPTVLGAPGDGQISLTSAIKKQLNNRGIKLSTKATQATYTVQGAVKLTPATQSNKQDIAIEWRVIDPDGRKIGTVSQRNTIPKGSLNGPWGKTAEAAASAAADGIMKLLPKPK